MIRNVISVIDGGIGSCGKGKVIGEIATDKSIKISAAITNCSPNSGHTFVDEKGNKTIFQNIPVSSVSPEIELFIAPGSSINMETFANEYERVSKYVKDRKIFVHERVPLIEERHVEYEKKHIRTGSTNKGCGAVNKDKMLRNQKLQFFKGFKNAIVCSSSEWLERLDKHLNNSLEYVILEGFQGCGLCLNHSENNPNNTYRNVSTGQAIADAGISPEHILQTIMTIRPYMIRISNITQDGKYIDTGGNGSGIEHKWTQINLASMYGSAPYIGDIDDTYGGGNLSNKKLRNIIYECPEIALKIVFGKNYKSKIKALSSITLLEALELERLMYKFKGKSIYQTSLIDLQPYEDYPENTIIDQSEQTTVTNLERKIFDLDRNKLVDYCRINTPSDLYLNFFQQLDYYYKGLTGNYKDYTYITYIDEFIKELESTTNVEICALGTGPKNNERILKKQFIKDIQK